MAIKVNLGRAKDIAHRLRRQERERQFEPLDARIGKRIPGVDDNEIEAKRQVIRDASARHQKAIDKARSVDALGKIVDELGG